MKRILAATAATLALAVAMPASAADFILSNNPANPNYNNFRITFADSTGVSADLGRNVGATSFTDNYFFATDFFGVGSGSAVTNIQAALNFGNPGLTITGYLLDGATQAALASAFTAADYSSELATVQARATAPNQTYFQAGTGSGLERQLQNVPLNPNYFYKISINGTGTVARSIYSGNLSATAVPEPATWAMMLAGFGAVGFAMRRRGKPQPKVRFAF